MVVRECLPSCERFNDPVVAESQVNQQANRPFAMKTLIFFLVLITATFTGAQTSVPYRLRVATYNIEFGRSCKPEELGKMLAEYRFDVVALCEAPGGDWVKRAGEAAGLTNVFLGKLSSANHKDKYKAILSRTPLTDSQEIKLDGQGWNPAGAVRAVTTIAGQPVAFYSLHICGNARKDPAGKLLKPGHSHDLAQHLKDKEPIRHVIVMGDFNNTLKESAMSVLLDAGMKAIWSDLTINLDAQFTWNALNPKQNAGVIDHVLYRDGVGMRTLAGGIIERQPPLSDHKPVWAELELSNGYEKK